MELEEEIKDEASYSGRLYLGNIKNRNAFHVLKNDFLCLTDGDGNGNLREINKDNMVFLKLLKCETEGGKRRHLAVCLKCNSLEKTKAIIDSVSKNVKVTRIFEKNNLVACIHATVGEVLFSKELSNSANIDDAKCTVIVDDEKQHLAISFDGETPGLIFLNKARKAKKAFCLKCKSQRCKHIQMWNQELKRDVLKDVIQNANVESAHHVEVNNDVENTAEVNEIKRQSIRYPYDKLTQEKMRELDGMQFENLTELISKPQNGEKCIHGHQWSDEDPREKKWIYSTHVKIAHSTYVKKRERKVFYKKTIGTCTCILLYDGKVDMLLPVSKHNPELTKVINSKHTRFGHTVNLVSLSLLSDFATDFFKNGTTMRGFYSAYQSKCMMKFGMEEQEVIKWDAWHVACVEFFTNILTIDEKEIFKCRNCGPRPSVLVIDGIAMGIQKSELNKYKSYFAKDLEYKSNVEISGSNFKDRMFVKLSKNRKILKNAAQQCIWPVPETFESSDSDPEFEIGE